MLHPQNNSKRRCWRLDGLWDFVIDPEDAGRDSHWEREWPAHAAPIAVPASWNEQRTDLYHYRGVAWYRRREYIPDLEAGQRVLLRFSGAQNTLDVYVNGKHVGGHTRPYLPAEWDVTEWVQSGSNVFIARVSGTIQSNEPAGAGDFYGYSGLARPVHLGVVNEKRITGIAIRTTIEKTGGKASLRVEAPAAARVIALLDGRENELIREGDGYAGEVRMDGVVPWTCETPRLYPLCLRLIGAAGDLLDEYILDVGFREVRVEGREILLNGIPTKLRGFNKHEDFPVVGKGPVEALNILDFDLMKRCGANSFRTSHYPYGEEILTLADRLGFLVIDEAPFAGLDSSVFNNAAAREKAVDCMRRLIERDRNHASVISWSIGNECRTDQEGAEAFFRPVIDIARSMDERPLTYVAWTKPDLDRVYPHVDIVGANRYYGWYPYECWPGSAQPGDLETGVAQLGECLDEFARLFSGPILLSEFGADAVAGLHSPFMLQFTEEFQAELITRYIRLAGEKPFIAGMLAWCFADFATEQSPGRVLGNRKGVFTRTREPKMAAHALRQLWTRDGDKTLGAPGKTAPNTISPYPVDSPLKKSKLPLVFSGTEERVPL